MPGSSNNNSFIPKKNSVKKGTQSSGRQVFIGTILVRILFFATLLAAIGVFVYEKKLTSDYESEVVALNQSISTFDEDELQRVLASEIRINQAKQRLNNSASIVSLLDAIEKATIGSSKIKSFSLERTSDTEFKVAASIETNSFDSVLFQKEIFENSDTLNVGEIKNLILDNVPPSNGLYTSELSSIVGKKEIKISFDSSLIVDVDKIHHSITPFDETNIDVKIPDSVVDSLASTTISEVSNSSDI